jgi:hypothetical protein
VLGILLPATHRPVSSRPDEFATGSMGLMHGYCTYFDSGYLSRGLALIESLRLHGDYSPVYVLALDEGVEKYFTEHALDNVHVLAEGELEASEPRLANLKVERSRMEYYFTCTPLLIRYVMNKLATPGAVSIYLDADLFFFDDPEAVVEALGDDSVGIIEHRYPASIEKKLAKYGRFNVGWVGFRDDARGRVVLDWYAASCLDWCSDTPADGKYADQGYLNWFPDFDGVRVLDNPGFNLAPWNTRRHRIELSSDSSKSVVVDGQGLVFFHVHGLRRVGSHYVTAQLVYGAQASSDLMRGIYVPYVEALEAREGILRTQGVDTIRVAPRGVGLRGVVSRLRKSALNAISIATSNAVRVRS